MYKKTTLLPIYFILSLLLFTACQDEVDIRDKDGSGVVGVMNNIESEGKFSTFYRAIGSNGLRISDNLNGSGPGYEYTIFAPTNEAFDKFLAKYDIYGSTGDIPTAVLRDIINYHIVPGKKSSGELSGGQKTLQGGDLSFSGTTITGASNTATITTADREARNGYLHELNEVLIPPTLTTQSIAQIAAGSDFATLAAALSRFPDLATAIEAGNGTYTVLAPNNAAFSALLATLPYTTLAEVPGPLLRTILEYHIIEGAVGPADISGVQAPLNGEELVLDTAAIVISNVAATNGRVYVLNQVLTPPSLNTIVGTVLTNPDFSTLAAALVNADLTAPLSQGKFTLFAPNNAAFTAAGVTDPNAVEASTLMYHVISDSVSSAMLMTGFYPTLQGASLAVTTGTLGGTTVNNATITMADMAAPGGVVHEINAVLMPPAQDVVALAQATPDLSTLAAAITKAGLADTLSKADYTVFAPTNAAFEALFTDLGVTGLDSLTAEQLTPVLLYHIIPGRLLSTQLPNGDINTLGGATFNLNNRVLTITTGSGQVVDISGGDFNIQASNGVVHIIDAVLVPK